MFQSIALGFEFLWLEAKEMGRFLQWANQRANQKNFTFIKELLEASKIKSIIDRCYKLSSILEVFKYFEEEQEKSSH